MKTELVYLTWVTALTGLLWVPYTLDRICVWGVSDTVGYPANPKPQSGWATRLMKAHANAVENLVVFAALVLAVMLPVSATVPRPRLVWCTSGRAWRTYWPTRSPFRWCARSHSPPAFLRKQLSRGNYSLNGNGAA